MGSQRLRGRYFLLLVPSAVRSDLSRLGPSEARLLKVGRVSVLSEGWRRPDTPACTP
jgi:hypothetical protein